MKHALHLMIGVSVLLFVFATFVFAVPDNTYSIDEEELFSYSAFGSGGQLQLNTPMLYWENADDNTETPILANAGMEGVAGGPQLPVYTRFIAVPEGMDASLLNFTAEWESAGTHRIAHDSGVDGSIALDHSLYDQAAFENHEVVIVGPTARWRDVRFAPVTIRPLRYNSQTNEVEVASSVDVELTFVPGMDEEYNPPGISEAFYPLYRELILGVDSELDALQVQRGSYLVIAPEDWEDELLDLIEWRTQCGYNVIFASTDETGTSNTQLRNYIWNQYETLDPPLEYVVLVGDVDTPANIATFSIPSGHLDPYIATDHKYTYPPNSNNTFEQVLPRFFIGRISVDNTTQLSTVIRKIRQYEITPDTAPLDRFERALTIADATYSLSCVQTNLWVRDRMLENGFTQVDTLYRRTWEGPSASDISNVINSGVSWINYRGFGSHTGWAGPYYINSDVAGLSNTNKLPVITSMVCGGGAFDELDDDPCFGEMWIRLGTQNNLRGAVAFVGPSEIDTHTRWNNLIDGGWYRGLFDMELRSLGQLLLAAKVTLYQGYPNNWNPGGTNQNSVWFYFHTYNILGDPALQVRREIPQEVVVEHPMTIPDDASFVPVSVEFETTGSPVSHAMVVVTKDYSEVIGSAYTGVDGTVNVVLTEDIDGDDIQIAVTRPDIMAYNEYVENGSSLGIALVSQQFSEDDEDEQTNGDGIINPGELVIPSATFSVLAADGIDDLSLTILLPHDGGNIVVASQDFGNLGFEDQVVVTTPRIRLESDLLTAQQVEVEYVFDGDAFSMHHSILFDRVQAPVLEVGDVEVSDTWAPGETTDLEIDLSNLSEDVPAGVVTGVLTTRDGFITVLEDTGTWPSIGTGDENNAPDVPFSIEADETAYRGYNVECTLTLTTEEGYVSSHSVIIEIGGVDETAPSGPAGPGYYMYEDIDEGFVYSAEDFQYETVSAIGTRINLNDTGDNQDRTLTVDLPFNFPFWYQSYNQVSICSNGWFSFEETELPFFRNRPIPSALTPGGAVAVFWDDLIQSSGGTYTYHDEENGWFVIDWYNVRHIMWGGTMRFQALLLDPAVWGTPGGMGIIVLLYDEISNQDATENYSTVGIISPDGNDGIEYEFANTNPVTSGGIQSGRKIIVGIGHSETMDPPNLVITPPLVQMNIHQGENATEYLEFLNTGEAPVWVDLYAEDAWPIWGTDEETGGQTASRNSVPNPEENPGIDDFGGPDEYGYHWMDSDDNGGTPFTWVDIAQPENEVTLYGEGNASISDAILLPFDFYYYGEDRDTLWICESGYVTFDNPGDEGIEVNYSLPRSIAPRSSLFPFWDNIGVDEGGTIYAHVYGDSIIVSWVDVYHMSWNTDDGPYTFQVLITSDGVVHFRYLDVNPRTSSCTIGIQNDLGSDGLQVLFNDDPEDYLHDSMTIRFARLLPWVSLTPDGAMLGAGEAQLITVMVNSSEMDPGFYNVRLLARTTMMGVSYSVPLQVLVYDDSPGIGPILFTIPGESIGEGDSFQSLHLGPYAYDPDNSDNTLDYVVYGEQGIAIDVDDDVASFVPTEEWDGNSTIRVRAFDPNMNFEEQTFQLSNTGLNDAPRFTSMNPELDTLALESEVTFSVGTLDPEQDDVEVSWYRGAEYAGSGEEISFSFDNPGNDTVRVVASDGTHESEIFWYLFIGAEAVESGNSGEIPDEFAIESIHPNPFNHRVTLRFALPNQSDVRVRVYNVLGQVVQTHYLPALAAGQHSFNINGQNWASGLYFFSIQAGHQQVFQKAMLVK